MKPPKPFIRITYELKKDWFDSYLTYQNLKFETKNQITQEDKNVIWTPFLTIINKESAEKDRIADKLDEIFQVVPNQNFHFTRNSKTNYQNAILFEV